MSENPYLNPQRVKAALRSLGLRPSRDLGQNFLVDPDALAQIVGAAQLSPADLAVEVGPGLGVLTWELLAHAGRVVAVEFDRRLAERLRDEFSADHFCLIERDILQIAPPHILAAAQPATPPATAYKLVANLPYAITAPVLRHFLESSAPPELSVLLVQWEVAERICAKPGDLNLLAHAIQFYSQPEIVARIPPSSFEPAPAVDSAILRLHRRTSAPVTVFADDVAGLFRIIKAGFLNPRKKIANSLPNGLAAHGFAHERAVVHGALEAAAIGLDQRAETITLAQWARLHALLASASH